MLKTKGTLLTAVLILTVPPTEANPSTVAVEHCCYLISQKLFKLLEVSLAARLCLETLITASQGNIALQYATSMLFPGAITFIVYCAAGDQAGAVACPPALEEVPRAITIFFNNATEQPRDLYWGAILPPIACLLTDGQPNEPVLFATSEPNSFKEAIGLINQGQKTGSTLRSDRRWRIGVRRAPECG